MHLGKSQNDINLKKNEKDGINSWGKKGKEAEEIHIW